MLKYAMIRLGGSVVVVLVVAIVVFSLTAISGGDPALIFAGDHASPADIEAIRARMGLDQPLVVRFAYWATEVVRGNLGVSLFTGTPVAELIRQRLEPTLALACLTILLSIVIAVPIGALVALFPRSRMDRIMTAICSIAFALPVFITGYLLIYFVSLKLGLLPVQGYSPLSSGLWSTLRTILLPSIALSFVYIALLARTTRAAMIEVLSQDYIRTARSKGATTLRVLLRHAIRNASNSIVTVIGLGIASLLSGVVIAETVFGIPGLGRLTVDAILNRDYPVIQGLILLAASVKIVVNLLIDLSYPFIDPRIKV